MKKSKKTRNYLLKTCNKLNRLFLMLLLLFSFSFHATGSNVFIIERISDTQLRLKSDGGTMPSTAPSERKQKVISCNSYDLWADDPGEMEAAISTNTLKFGSITLESAKQISDNGADMISLTFSGDIPTGSVLEGEAILTFPDGELKADGSSYKLGWGHDNFKECLVTIETSSLALGTPKPNVLLIIADDLGVDVLNINHSANTIKVDNASGDFPLNNLATLMNSGVYFSNAWATPTCSPTRATIFTGCQPWRTGVGYASGNNELANPITDGSTLITIAQHAYNNQISTGLFGKWHLGDDLGTNTPIERGWSSHVGNLLAGLTSGNSTGYEDWEKHESDGAGGYLAPDQVANYATRDVIQETKEWIAAQTETWFATVAFNAPHDPFHDPPADDLYSPSEPIYSASLTVSDKNSEYNAQVQSLDYYLQKLWIADTAYPTDISGELANTVIIFVGDNGSPEQGAILADKAKKTVYIGGVHVPLIIADGAKLLGYAKAAHLSNISTLETAQANIADFYKTITELLTGGTTLPTGMGTNSHSLVPYLKGTTPSSPRTYNFSQKYEKDGAGSKLELATVSNGVWKLNYQTDPDDDSVNWWELYNIKNDPEETTNKINNQNSTAVTNKEALYNWLIANHFMNSGLEPFPSLPTSP